MDPVIDCPICFEEYTPDARCSRLTPCCGQALCEICNNALRCCPFCREVWHDEGGDERGVHDWLRPAFRNPVLIVAPALYTTAFLGNELIMAPAVQTALSASVTGIRTVATAAAAVLAEASPAAMAGAAVGGAALAGGVAVALASRHSDRQAAHMRNIIRARPPYYPTVPWHQCAQELFLAVQWYLAPQREGLPQVYHGSPWRSRAREDHRSSLQQLCDVLPRDTEPSPSQQIWADLLFVFSLWLDYNPHTANWGTSDSYGLPPHRLCWHNNWREDLRHAVSDLARHLQSGQAFRHVAWETKEHASALCLLGTLDHVLSWSVYTPEHGRSELVPESSIYRNFCKGLRDRFAAAWAAAQAPPEVELECVGFGVHIGVMAARQVPGGFRGVW